MSYDDDQRAKDYQEWEVGHGLQMEADARNSGGGGGGCFPANTKIKTVFGERDLSSLKSGDFVFSYSSSKELVENPVLKVERYKNVRLYQIFFKDGTKITTTKSHSFYNQSKWIEAQKLSNGDMVSFFENGREVQKEVDFFQNLSNENIVYNLIVANDFNFIANDALAHSFSKFRSSRMLFWNFVDHMKRCSSVLIKG